ncbi:MAG: F0F1 ATP synthase subunit epsilon [Chloroflexi bacterium]|nr:F0F1 ATP synthase subunit epsilon [Chloroflexota bacterium]
MAITFKLEVVCIGNMVFSGEVESLVVPGIEGQLGVLAHHAPLMTILEPGEVVMKKGGEETVLAVSGGFMEVRPDKVVILADACERAEDIDIRRAEEAKKRAEERLKCPAPGMDLARAEAALRRSIARLRVAEVARRRKTAQKS